MHPNKARRTCKEEIGGCRATTKPRGCYWGMSVVGGGLIGALLLVAVPHIPNPQSALEPRGEGGPELKVGIGQSAERRKSVDCFIHSP